MFLKLYECLALAITRNLVVQRWLFKLDDEHDGRGIAYFDIAKHLSCYAWALKEMVKFGDKWSKRWAHEATFVKILEEIPEVLEKYARPVNETAYPTWQAFLGEFLAHGGVVEAYPPSDSVTCLTVSMLIEPDGRVSMLASGDQLHAESSFSCWGLTFPQTSVNAKRLNEACYKIADACKQRDVIGHFDIDFVTFIDMESVSLVLPTTTTIKISSASTYLS